MPCFFQHLLAGQMMGCSCFFSMVKDAVISSWYFQWSLSFSKDLAKLQTLSQIVPKSYFSFFLMGDQDQTKGNTTFCWACCPGLCWKVKLQTYFEGPCQSPGVLRGDEESLVVLLKVLRKEHECSSRVFRRNDGWGIVQTKGFLTEGFGWAYPF